MGSFLSLMYGFLPPQESPPAEVCRIHEGEETVLVEGLREVEVGSSQDLLQVYKRGSANRHAGTRQSNFLKPEKWLCLTWMPFHLTRVSVSISHKGLSKGELASKSHAIFNIVAISTNLQEESDGEAQGLRLSEFPWLSPRDLCACVHPIEPQTRRLEWLNIKKRRPKAVGVCSWILLSWGDRFRNPHSRCFDHTGSLCYQIHAVLLF